MGKVSFSHLDLILINSLNSLSLYLSNASRSPEAVSILFLFPHLISILIHLLIEM